MTEKKENLVKDTAKELGMTYRQLGEAIGYSEDTLKQAGSTGKISEPLQRAIEMYLEIIELKKEKEDLSTLKNLLKNFIG